MRLQGAGRKVLAAEGALHSPTLARAVGFSCAVTAALVSVVRDAVTYVTRLAYHHFSFVSVGFKPHAPEQLNKELKALLEPLRVSGAD
jgi:hypothetical protein